MIVDIKVEEPEVVPPASVSDHVEEPSWVKVSSFFLLSVIT